MTRSDGPLPDDRTTVGGSPPTSPMTAVEFAAVARLLAGVARRRGVAAPCFRSPPGVVGLDRTVRRRGRAGAVVSVRLAGRSWMAVLADMVEGVVVAGGLGAPEADRVREAMWKAVAAAQVGAPGAPSRAA